ncbi:MAG: helix-hairpin-helix domain-containing protein [Campylobacterota bacterium]|nr:helix-hairpin-helix domain-containing protein [Campylobacterota bacterium]
MVKMFKVLALISVLASSLLFGMSVSEINKASKEELMEIKGIGMAKADAIMKQRAVMPFKSMADVEAVKGVGPALVKNIENDVHKK